MKANHPVEAHRWTQAIAKSIEWYKMRDGAESDTSSIVAGGSLRRIKSTRRKSAESDSSMMRTSPSMHSQSLSGFWKKTSPGNGSTLRDQDSDLDMTDVSPDMLRDVGPPEQNIADKVYNEEDDGDDASSRDQRLLNALQREGAGFLRFAKACIEKERRMNSTRSPTLSTWEKSTSSAMFYRARTTGANRST